jgi:hypothetical protein
VTIALLIILPLMGRIGSGGGKAEKAGG